MSYYILGRNCTPATIALTSNTKFILPLNKIYDVEKNKNIKNEVVSEDDKDLNFYKRVVEEILSNRVEKLKTFDNKCSTC